MKKAIILLSIIIMAGSTAFVGLKVYRVVFGVNISDDEPFYVLYIPTGSTYVDVIDLLERDSVLTDSRGFEWLAKRMKYHENVKPGRYVIQKDMTNKKIIQKLRAGIQDAVKVFFNKYRTKQDLAGFVSKKLEADSAQLVQLLNDSAFLAKYNFNKQTALAIFISDQYEFFWNISAEKLMERMAREYEKFWKGSREQRARSNNLTPIEAITLASIVEEETTVNAEKPRIAGVYINRLKKNMKLQADPTVKFAVGDFNIKRVLNRHLHFDSPYNTYKVEGLPPGPICIPSKESIEAVLNAETHDYLFFCAKGDNTGTHAFARTYKDHLANARKYRKLLDDVGIF